MDLNKALLILEIEQLTNLTDEYIKKKYHKLALINHPDKNGNSLESTNKFQEINEAYDFLLKELHIINKPNTFVSSSESKETNSKYVYLLSLFISSIIEGWNKDIIKK
jgi:preprotein translocase subunit Sec63